MTPAIGQRWIDIHCLFTKGMIIEIITDHDTDLFGTVVVSQHDNLVYKSLGWEEGYYKDRFSADCTRSGSRFEYLPGQDKPI